MEFKTSSRSRVSRMSLRRPFWLHVWDTNFGIQDSPRARVLILLGFLRFLAISQKTCYSFYTLIAYITYQITVSNRSCFTHIRRNESYSYRSQRIGRRSLDTCLPTCFSPTTPLPRSTVPTPFFRRIRLLICGTLSDRPSPSARGWGL